MTDLFQATAQNEYQRAAAHLKGSKDASAALTKSYARYEVLIAKSFDESSQKPACQAGCGFCCYYKVEARAHEVLVVKDYIRKHFNTEKIAAVTQALESNAALIRTFTPEQHLTTNLKCALLDDNQCSIYPARPFRCRNFHSTDVSACEASFNDPVSMTISTGMIEPVAVTADGHTQGFEAAAEQTGRDNRIYDFTTALLETLTSEQPLRRYQRGKQTFQQALVVE
ncbi:MAG: YkgJ family cysteine cluster protein [Marinagarivorans sp.]|nr:YkgJ family cysteine cluster protein [Marinagarivorans sp.]